MTSVEEKREQRFKFLNALYEMSDGKTTFFIDIYQISSNTGIAHGTCFDIAHYLEQQGLIRIVAVNGLFAITHNGIVEIENALSEPDKPTEYFPAINIINIDHMENSQIQQGSIDATQGKNNKEKSRIQLKRKGNNDFSSCTNFIK